MNVDLLTEPRSVREGGSLGVREGGVRERGRVQRESLKEAERGRNQGRSFRKQGGETRKVG